MSTLSYHNSVPLLSKWLSDSSVAFAKRDADRVLSRIDTLVGLYHTEGNPHAMSVITCDLFWTLDYWLKEHKTNRVMEKGRLPAVHALYETVVRVLCFMFDCTVNVLPRELELMFGEQVGQHGYEVDSISKKASYLARAEIRQYRLWFKGGLAYQHPWWEPTARLKELRLANSSEGYSKQTFSRNPVTQIGYGPFVMTMGREIYMAKHKYGEENKSNGIYHSTYTAGETVMCAGSMLIVNGKLRRVRTDSGHYQPGPNSMVGLILCLQMHAVRTDDLLIEHHTGYPKVLPATFLRANGDWTVMRRERQKKLDELRKLPGVKRYLDDQKRKDVLAEQAAAANEEQWNDSQSEEFIPYDKQPDRV